MKVTLLDRRRPRRPNSDASSKAAGETPALQEPFWKTKTLEQMSTAEWESLCDGCGKCCVFTLEDADNGQLYRTDVACKLLDGQTGQCSNYPDRKKYVPDCVKLTPKKVPKLDWLPTSCAYRLVANGEDLKWWHPLVSGDPSTVHLANASVRGKTRPQGRMKEPGLMKRIVEWPTPLEKPPKGYKRKRSK